LIQVNICLGYEVNVSLYLWLLTLELGTNNLLRAGGKGDGKKPKAPKEDKKPDAAKGDAKKSPAAGDKKAPAAPKKA
jgi:hypothetical protein